MPLGDRGPGVDRSSLQHTCTHTHTHTLPGKAPEILTFPTRCDTKSDDETDADKSVLGGLAAP